jgi:hypothetical protein
MEEHQNATDMENAESTLQDGIDQGYGHWLEPFAANRDDRTNQTPEIASSNSSGQTQTEPVPERRKRGRPRVNTTRNGSAIEVSSCL